MNQAKQSNKWLVLVGTGISAILIAIDYSIVNTCLGNIQRELHASVNQLQWVMVGFGLFFATLMVTLGRIADIFGRKKVLLIGVLGFGLASLGAGLSQSIQVLIAFRLAQGFFGATIFPAGTAIVSDVFPKDQRGRALGIYFGLVGIGLAFGPVVGGAIVSVASWRWIFLVNVPVVLVSFVICFLVVSESRIKTKVAIDYLGVVLTTIFLAAFSLAVTQGPLYGWDSILIIGLFVISLVSLICLIRVELRAKDPLLPLKLFNKPGFITGALVNFSGISLSWAIIFFVPLYLHNVLYLSAGKVGLTILPMTMMTLIAPMIGGYFFDRYGRFKTILVFYAFLFIGLGLQLFFGKRPDDVLLYAALVIFGIGWGLANGVGTPIALSDVEDTENIGVISGTLSSLLNAFGVVILTVSGVVFHYVEKSSQADAFARGFHGVIILLLVLAFSLFFPAFYYARR